MQLKLGAPRKGWLPVHIEIGGRYYDFRASHVVNDPISDFLTAAIWCVAPDYQIPLPRAGHNEPYTQELARSVHFWMEPVWHSLLVERHPTTTQIDLWFYSNHEGGLYVEEHHLNTAAITPSEQMPAADFSQLVFTAVDSATRLAGATFEHNWYAPVNYALLTDLQALVQQL